MTEFTHDTIHRHATQADPGHSAVTNPAQHGAGWRGSWRSTNDFADTGERFGIVGRGVEEQLEAVTRVAAAEKKEEEDEREADADADEEAGGGAAGHRAAARRRVDDEGDLVRISLCLGW